MSLVGSWAALQDPAFAVPLRGAVSRIAEAFALSASEAGNLLEAGLLDGRIALLNAATGHVWRPSATALAKQVNWGEGCLAIPGLPDVPLVIHWPNVEALARDLHQGGTIHGEALPSSSITPLIATAKPGQAIVDRWMVAYYQTASDEGRSPPKRDSQAFPDCRGAIGASERQMREAMKSVPDYLKRHRGERS